MKNKDRYDHGLHNEEVCDYINLRTEYTDWIITTAFYGALQFVSSQIFPFKFTFSDGKSRSITDIDDYYHYKQAKKSRHAYLSELVYENVKSVGEDYEWLLSISKTARYNNYQSDKLIADKAVSLMKTIKKACTK